MNAVLHAVLMDANLTLNESNKQGNKYRALAQCNEQERTTRVNESGSGKTKKKCGWIY